MTLLQIEYAATCARYGSMSHAADKLYISLSNLSKAIASLESELGYQIFERHRTGLLLTVQGKEFVEYANCILNESQRIREINRTEESYNCSIITFSCSFCFNAYAELVKNYEDMHNIRFHLNVSNFHEEIIRKIATKECHLGLLAIPMSSMPQYLHIFKQRNIQATHLADIPICVKLRKTHPLLENNKDEFDFNRLSEYPCIDYHKDENLPSDILKGTSHADTIKIDKLITVGDRDWKHQLISYTNCYSVGQMEDENPIRNRDYDLVNIPIPGVFLSLYALTHCDAHFNKTISEYLTLLEKRLKQLSI